MVENVSEEPLPPFPSDITAFSTSARVASTLRVPIQVPPGARTRSRVSLPALAWDVLESCAAREGTPSAGVACV